MRIAGSSAPRVGAPILVNPCLGGPFDLVVLPRDVVRGLGNEEDLRAELELQLLRLVTGGPQVPASTVLTPVQRARLGRAVIEEGWLIASVARFYWVSWPTVAKWVERYALMGRAEVEDRSSRPVRQPMRTPQPVVRKIVHHRLKKRGDGGDLLPCRCPSLDCVCGAQALPAESAIPCGCRDR